MVDLRLRVPLPPTGPNFYCLHSSQTPGFITVSGLDSTQGEVGEGLSDGG